MEISQTRDKIMEDTFGLLLSKGYDGVSISDIQKATGMSRGILYHYFDSKELLFSETIRCKLFPYFEVDKERIKDYCLSEMVRYIISTYESLTNQTLHDGVSILNFDFLFYRAMQEHVELTQAYNSIRDDEIRGWQIALGNSLAKGEIIDTISIDRLARQFVYIADGVWLQAVSPSLVVDLISNLESAFDTLCEMIYKK